MSGLQGILVSEVLSGFTCIVLQQLEEADTILYPGSLSLLSSPLHQLKGTK